MAGCHSQESTDYGFKKEKGCINQNDLSVAVNYLRTNFLEEEYTTIEECIKELKTLREKEKNEKKGK